MNDSDQIDWNDPNTRVDLALFAGKKAKEATNNPDKYPRSVGADNKDRYEIDDSQAKLAFTPEQLANSLRMYPKGAAAPLKSLLNHPDLYKNYPEFEDMNVVLDPELQKHNMGGMYDLETKQMYLNPSQPFADQRGTLLHELQHAIQQKEGFASGGSPEAIKQGVFGQDLKSNNPDTGKPYTPQEIKFRNQVADQISRAQYLRTMGEAESRNVEYRAPMSLETRKKYPPKLSADIQFKDQISPAQSILPDNNFLNFLESQKNWEDAIPGTPPTLQKFGIERDALVKILRGNK